MISSIKEPGADTSKVAIAAMDTLLWQALASVIVPGEIIKKNSVRFYCCLDLIPKSNAGSISWVD